jgi:hypothetical protein
MIISLLYSELGEHMSNFPEAEHLSLVMASPKEAELIFNVRGILGSNLEISSEITPNPHKAELVRAMPDEFLPKRQEINWLGTDLPRGRKLCQRLE